MKYILVFITALSFYSLHAQKVVVQLKDVIGEDKGRVKESFTITNKEDGSFALFLIDTRSTRAYLYDKDYKEVGVISNEKILKEGTEILGYTITNQTYTLISRGSDRGSMTSISFDFEAQEISEKKLDFNIKDEKYLEYFNLGEKVYVFTLDKDSSDLIHYSIDANGQVARNAIEIENTFYDSSGREMSLKKILNDASTAKVLPDNKTTIKQASELLKIYFINNKQITLTVDYNNSVVNIFNISLDTFKVSEQTFFRPKPKVQEYGWNANSFIKDDYLFQIVSTKKEMIVSITNMVDSTLVKTINVDKKEEMTFTNSPMILEGTETDKELESTSQFLRKIAIGNNGIAVSTIGDHYQITLGGQKSYQKMGPSGGMPGMGIPIAGIGGITLAFSPGFMMGDLGTSSSYTSVECIFDTSFNHIPDEEAAPLMMKRRDFLSPDIKNVAETFFNIGDNYFLGMYYKKADMYLIRKF